LRSSSLEVAAPGFTLGDELRGCRIRPGVRIVHRGEIPVEGSGARHLLEELRAQLRVVEPIRSQKSRARGGIGRSRAVVDREQILDERKIVRESLVRVEVHLLRQGRVERRRSHDLPEVRLEFGALEDLRDLPRELGKILIAPQPQIPARELLLPSGVRELRGGVLVDLLHLRAHAVLIEERRQLFVEGLVLRIVIDLPPKESQRIVGALHLYHASDVTIEHLPVLQFPLVFAREFLQQRIVDRALVVCAPLARVSVCHGERHSVMLKCLRIRREKLASRANHAIVIAVLRIRRDQGRMQLRRFLSVRKARIQQIQQLRHPRPMKIRHRRLILVIVFFVRRLVVQDQRKDSV
jgi:hypothetical protein